ncbi:MAG: hypothetical protein Q4A82_03465 [Corynebacterium sp.]|nr:hypothetical protein [Corynebacterium sp.]
MAVQRAEVLAALGDVWAANPRLTLHELFDVLSRTGLQPDSSNDEALGLCHYLSSLKPARAPLDMHGRVTTPTLLFTSGGPCALYPHRLIFYGERQPLLWGYQAIQVARLHRNLAILTAAGEQWMDPHIIQAIELIDTTPDIAAPYAFVFEGSDSVGLWQTGKLRVVDRGRRDIITVEHVFPLVWPLQVGDDTPAGVIKECYKLGNGV